MNETDGVIFLDSAVIFLFCLFVIGQKRNCYGYEKDAEQQQSSLSKWMICECNKNRKTQTQKTPSASYEEGNTQFKKSPKHGVNQHLEIQAEQLKTLQEELKRHRSEVVTLREELNEQTKEKDDALKRLSAIMSSRLRDGNPNVVDLSDQNRPLKVGEQFSELYDNQWTDAYSALEAFFVLSKQEPEIISILFDILQKCFMVCKDKSNRQLTYMAESVTNIAAAITKKNNKLSTDLMQRIKEERKMFAYDELPECDTVLPILKDYFSSYVLDINFLEEDSLKAFVQECLKLSWLMVIQDPPMAMVLRPDDNANDNFKAYKHRGKHVAFVVWPALLLEEGGPLIMKGIAEFNAENLFDP